MFYGESVQDTRQFFLQSWRKHREKHLLTALEAQIVDVIAMHPEYHALLEANISQHDQIYSAEMGQSNPFLHMGLHLAIRDQVATDRPIGFASLFQKLLKKYADVHQVEHLIMEPLAECLWNAQRSNSMLNEAAYLTACYAFL